MDNEQIIKLVIVLVVISFIYTTIKAVVVGVYEGLRNTRDILKGSSYEDIKERNRKKQDEAFEKDIKKMDSKLYRCTHPLEYLNCMLMKKLRERANDGKRI